MPQTLISSSSHVAVAAARPEQQVRREDRYNEEDVMQQGEEQCHVGTMDSIEIDFFTDDYANATASATKRTVGDAECDDDTETRMNATKKTVQLLHREGAMQYNVLADCDVCLQLRGGSRDGRGGTFVLNIPAAISLSPPSQADIPSANASSALPTSCASKYHAQEVCGEEAPDASSRGGAAWSGHCCTSSWNDKTPNGDEEAAYDSCFVKSSIQNMPLARKEVCATNDDDGNDAYHKSMDPGDLYSETTLSYVMHLPPKFVLGLRLPSEVEGALVAHYEGEVLMSLPPSLEWLSAFVYTANLRYRIFNSSSSSSLVPVTPETPQGLMEESTAVAVLEGICIASLNVVAQMGQLRRHRARWKCSADATSAAQNDLMCDSGLFSPTEVERVRRWLQRYMPPEVYSGDDSWRVSCQQQCNCFSWPSAVEVVFHVALDLAQALFPSLVLALESAILVALQPLLEARGAETLDASALFATNATSAVNSFSSCSLRLPKRRKHAVMLLTQVPTEWYGWWQQNSAHEGSNSHCCTSAIAASRIYAAVRVLQCFTLTYTQHVTGAVDFASDGEEECELAHFLLSAPALFTELLLDREVTSVLERAVKEMGLCSRTLMEEEEYDEKVMRSPPRLSHALVRCFFVLVCWLTFRPTGYSQAVARTFFGQLLRLAASKQEQRIQHLRGRDDEERLPFLLAACSFSYFSVASTLLRKLRDRCGAARHVGYHESSSRVNPWRQLRHGLAAGGLLVSDDDRTTNTSCSRRSVGPFRSTAVAAETTLAHQLPVVLDATAVNDVATAAAATAAVEMPAHSLQTLRHVIRKIRPVLRLLEKDVFVGQSEPGDAAVAILGTKRCREQEGAKDVSMFSLAGQGPCWPKLCVSPCYTRPDIFTWEWHMECSESSDDDATGTSPSSSCSGGSVARR
ncbi:putative PTP1-interacting protein, 39 kDa [Trypanosoma grayi]|uniref:putative PTP1-interacting protein, 39 kDa n=1 Tax=Trypanosoma grayi TaxID=71804 RepID=UPI0004F444CF|nr:putative PTP1-interacting protein, 39 kDa [Trypanosoma grayi]KEG15563.1 putative PTP1-interacting protein, 39 kDa [Trypanosoma grayi]